jgi:hypothetical protein
MKKISSKIIISVLLAIFLFSGINFDFEKKDTNIVFGVEKAYAAGWGEWLVAAGGANPLVAPVIAIQNLLNPNKIPTLASVGGGEVVDGIIKTVMMVNGALLQLIAIPTMSFLLKISATMLDKAVTLTLSTDIFENSSSGINIIWSLIRDFCNITFIFILLWVSIQTIIGTAGGKTKKVIADVVIAALLINFSLFITRIIIDAGNILAINIYDQIHTGETASGISYAEKGLGEILMQSMGMSGIMGPSKTAAGASPTGVWSVQFGVISYLQLFTLSIAFVTFVYAMLLMVVRIVSLIFLAALSPIGFMGNVLPKLASYSKQWRETLYGQVMLAPIFLLFVYLILRVSSAFNPIPKDGPGSLTDAPNTAETYQAYFKYIMIIVLLIVAVKITKKMTGAIGAAVDGIAKSAIGLAVGAAAGGWALVGSRVIGGVGNMVSKSSGLANIAAGKSENKYLNTMAGRFIATKAMRAGESVSKSSFDVRNSSQFKKISGAIADQTGIKVDYNSGIKIKKDGYQGIGKRFAEREEATAKLIQNSNNSSVKEETVTEEVTKRKTEIANKITKQKTEAEAIRLKERIIGINEEERESLKKLGEEIKKNEKTAEEINEDKVTAELVADANRERVKSFAESIEESFVSRAIAGRRGRKEAASKIRKVAKGKTDEEKMMEELAKQLKAKEKEQGGDKPKGKPDKEESREEEKTK